MKESEGQNDLERLARLVNQRCNGSLSLEGHDELHELIERSPVLRKAYWDRIALHVDLCWVVAGRAESDATDEKPIPYSLERKRVAEVAESDARHSAASWRTTAVAAAVVAVALSGGVLFALRHDRLAPVAVAPDPGPGEAIPSAGEGGDPTLPSATPPTTQQAPVAARLAPLAPNSRWFFGRPGDQNPKEFQFSDTVWVEEGSVELRMEDGTVGELTAPVALQLLSENRVRLLRGKARFHAPERAQGFTVETPSAEVVDLGTVFSVEASPAGTDLVVYDGKVDLRIPENPSDAGQQLATSKQFSTGQAVRVDRSGTLSRLMQVRSNGGRKAPAERSRPPIIASVTDNLSRSDHWAFYEIVLGGMQEDVLAYVDRQHEWNGVDADGMPEYLVGADYVRMFNDDKWVDGFKLDVVLSRPATLYVLLDDRVIPPRWLSEAFVETGDRIGIDEDRDDRNDDDDPVGVGPGESIDVTCSIWRLDSKEGGAVVLGPNGKDPEAHDWFRSMYGVVAAPLDQEE